MPAVLPARRDATGQALGGQFAGSPASTGIRLAAFSLDVLAVAAVTAATALATDSLLLAALCLVEVCALLWIVEARTGATLGNLLVRVRTSRLDAPVSAGTGRTAARNVVIGSGFFAFFFGAWVVVGANLAGKATKTVSVAVPKRAPRSGAAQAPVPMAPAAMGPHVQDLGTHPARGLGAARVVQAGSLGQSGFGDSASVSHTDVPASAPAAPAPPPVQAANPPVIETIVVQPAPGAAQEPLPVAAPEPEPVALLLVFDTGQREQITLPGAGYLGRRPVGTAPHDQEFSINDPDSSVSKTHLRLEYGDGRVWVTDLGSTNGTDLMSDEGLATRLPANAPTAVEPGARIRMGNRIFTASPLLGSPTEAGDA